MISSYLDFLRQATSEQYLQLASEGKIPQLSYQEAKNLLSTSSPPQFDPKTQPRLELPENLKAAYRDIPKINYKICTTFQDMFNLSVEMRRWAIAFNDFWCLVFKTLGRPNICIVDNYIILWFTEGYYELKID